MDPNPVAPNNQKHDFNADTDPFPNGLFWTTRIPEGSVRTNLGLGTASLDVSDVALEDYYNLANSLSDGKFATPVEGSATCHVRWSGITTRASRRNADQGFAGEFVETGAHMSWSATNALGFSFQSDPIGTSHSLFAQFGFERNGRFFV